MDAYCKTLLVLSLKVSGKVYNTPHGTFSHKRPVKKATAAAINSNITYQTFTKDQFYIPSRSLICLQMTKSYTEQPADILICFKKLFPDFCVESLPRILHFGYFVLIW